MTDEPEAPRFHMWCGVVWCCVVLRHVMRCIAL